MAKKIVGSSSCTSPPGRPTPAPPVGPRSATVNIMAPSARHLQRADGQGQRGCSPRGHHGVPGHSYPSSRQTAPPASVLLAKARACEKGRSADKVKVGKVSPEVERSRRRARGPELRRPRGGRFEESSRCSAGAAMGNRDTGLRSRGIPRIGITDAEASQESSREAAKGIESMAVLVRNR